MKLNFTFFYFFWPGVGVGGCVCGGGGGGGGEGGSGGVGGGTQVLHQLHQSSICIFSLKKCVTTIWKCLSEVFLITYFCGEIRKNMRIALLFRAMSQIPKHMSDSGKAVCHSSSHIETL